MAETVVRYAVERGFIDGIRYFVSFHETKGEAFAEAERVQQKTMDPVRVVKITEI